MTKVGDSGYRLAMTVIRKLCFIDPKPQLVAAAEEAGYELLLLRTGKQPFFDLAAALDEHGFEPELVMQTETLADRTIVTGLDTVDCPTMFWAMDPHLNAYWHSAYARLFDVTCSTQRQWIPRIKRQGATDVRWLPIFGRAEPWKPMAERQLDMAFVGRITPQRPARQWMVKFLREKAQGHTLSIEDNLTYTKMMELYGDSRIIPNESIFGEVNFRLFEAASCGCLVMSQDLGEEQEALFEPGREFDTYADVVELDHKLSWYLDNPRLVQAMGMAARERVLSEHLPEHRLARLVSIASEATRCRVTGVEASKWETLTAVAMWEAGLLVQPVKTILARLADLDQDGDIVAALLRVQSGAKLNKAMSDNLKVILTNNICCDVLDVNLAGSMAALRLDEWDWAKSFWYRHLRSGPERRLAPPTDKFSLLTLWAKELKRADRVVRAGFSFNVEHHLPMSATDCLMTILSEEPEHLPTLRLLDTMLRPIMGLEQARVGFLSILTLFERTDWRLALEIALANLRSYRLESGLEELELAQSMAREQGQESLFRKALATRDRAGLLSRHLAKG
ncbi:MAG: hypothetical protein CL942_11835 [Desulfovibrio sp.]|nr:hypothetical protein [Desulfovibrio sp.]|tara:strand:- start:13816 stop:15510 length:1695 start_codon:yes stop_codon:yes gene_type:complete